MHQLWGLGVAKPSYPQLSPVHSCINEWHEHFFPSIRNVWTHVYILLYNVLFLEQTAKNLS